MPVFDVHILVIQKESHFNKFFDLNDLEGTRLAEMQWSGFRGCYSYFLDEEGVAYFIIFLNHTDVFTIIHECTHIVHSICDNKGIPLTVENTETVAYMTTYLCQEVDKLITKPKRKKK